MGVGFPANRVFELHSAWGIFSARMERSRVGRDYGAFSVFWDWRLWAPLPGKRRIQSGGAAGVAADAGGFWCFFIWAGWRSWWGSFRGMKSGWAKVHLCGCFDRWEFPAPASVMNFVVLTAALSSAMCNLYFSARLLFSLARGGYAPARSGKLSKRGMPVAAVMDFRRRVACWR